MRLGDRLIGILIGIAILLGFLFLGSEETIDAPSLSDEPARTQTQPTEPGPR